MNIFRRAMAFLLFLTLLPAPAQAKILAGPYLQNPTLTSITIRWISDDGGTSVIQYGSDLNLTVTGANGIFHKKLGSYFHEVTISGLQPNMRYAYRVSSNGTLSEHYNFKTAPASGSPISFLAISDAQMKPDL